MGIVQCSCRLANAIHFTKVRNNLIIKGPSLITMDLGWNAKNAKPLLNQQFGNDQRFLAGCNKSLAEFRKGISENKDVLFSTLSLHQPW